MSNYTIQVDWSGKDALADSNPEKVISGDDFDTEFSSVQTAVNTKANLNGDSGESFSALTAAVGTDSTQVATTAYVMAASPTLGVNGVNVNGTLVTGRTIYVDTDAPSGGANGDIWFEY